MNSTVRKRSVIIGSHKTSISLEGRFSTGLRQIARERAHADIESRVDVLSPREREVADLVANGLSNKEVARRLRLTEGTVKLHLHRVFQKLGAKNRYSLIVGGLLRKKSQESAVR